MEQKRKYFRCLLLLPLLFFGLDAKIVSGNATKDAMKISAQLLMNSNQTSSLCVTVIIFNNHLTTGFNLPTSFPTTIFTTNEMDMSKPIIWCPWVLLHLLNYGNYSEMVQNNLRKHFPRDSKYLIVANHDDIHKHAIDAISKAVAKAILIKPSKKSDILWNVFSRPNFLKPFRKTAILRAEKTNLAKNIISDLNQRNATSFLGENVVASTFHYIPYNRFDDKGRLIGGFEGNLMMLLMRHLNLSMLIQPPRDGEVWGRQSPEGSLNFTGISGDVQFRRADLAFAYLFVTAPRLKVMDFSTWYMQDPSCALVKKPSPMPKILVVLWPFDFATWVLFGMMIALTSSFFLLAFKLISELPQEHNNSSQLFPVMAAIIFSKSQNISSQAKWSSFRFGWLLILLVMVVLSHGYAGSLTSMLTKDTLFPPIDTFEALHSAMRRGQITQIHFCCPSFFEISKSHPSKIVREIGRTAGMESEHAKDELYGDIVEHGNSVFFYTRLTLEFIIAEKLSDEYGNTKVEVMKECFGPSWAGIALQKQSRFKNSVDRALNEMKEAGLIEMMIEVEREVVARSKGIRTKVEDDKPKILTLDEIQAPLIILTAMLLVSTLFFLAETVAH